MHSIKLEVPGVGTCFVHHNSDWSGDAILIVDSRPVIGLYGQTTRHEGGREIKVPGKLLLALVQHRTESCVEQAEDLLKMLKEKVR